MDNLTAIMIVERFEEYTEEEHLKAWQHLIDTGLAWQLQGSFARAARWLIEQGICHEPN